MAKKLKRCEICDMVTCFHITGISSPRAYHVGYELEFLYTGELHPDLYAYGRIQDDGSIEPDSFDGWDGACREFASFAMTYPLVEGHVTDVCNYLEAADAFANESCGLHVHFNRRVFTSLELKRIFWWWRVFEPVMFDCVEQDRRHNRYCMPVGPTKTIRNWRTNRYHSLNISDDKDHGTFEFRLHHGTVSAPEIIGWIHLLNQYVQRAKSEPRNKAFLAHASARDRLRLLLKDGPIRTAKHALDRLKNRPHYKQKGGNQCAASPALSATRPSRRLWRRTYLGRCFTTPNVAGHNPPESTQREDALNRLAIPMNSWIHQPSMRLSLVAESGTPSSTQDNRPVEE